MRQSDNKRLKISLSLLHLVCPNSRDMYTLSAKDSNYQIFKMKLSCIIIVNVNILCPFLSLLYAKTRISVLYFKI